VNDALLIVEADVKKARGLRIRFKDRVWLTDDNAP
jgi:hypothetical protein